MDTVSNMLVALVNAQQVGKPRVLVPYSHFNKDLLDVFQKQGFIAGVREEGEIKKKLMVTLHTNQKMETRLHGITRISRPGGRVYVSHQNIPYPRQGNALIYISTSKGLMDGVKARRERLGGEIVCEVW